MVLRPTLNADPALPAWVGPGAAHVCLAAAAAGPIGGDQLRLDVDVGAGATLVLRTVAATLALPGPHAETSHSVTTIRVGSGATLVWLPEPTIAAHRCDHRIRTDIQLGRHARLISREELLLGRHGEPSGAIRQRLRVTQDTGVLHDQELSFDDSTPAWQGSAVTGGRRALGNLLCVDGTRTMPDRQAHVDTDVAVLPVGESASLVTALADDALALRGRLDGHYPESEGDIAARAA